jgi:hypothetical protein
MSPVNPEFENLLHELRADVLGQMIGFAVDMAEEIDSFAARQIFGMSNESPSYPRQFSIGVSKPSTTHVNQLILLVGALSFFWHAIDRLSFRPNNETLRAEILDPIAISLSDMLAEVLNKKGMNMTGTHLLIGMQNMSLRYAGAPTLIGTSLRDKTSAVWLAAHAIAEDVGYPEEVFAGLMHGNLLGGLATLDLGRRIEALEAVL